MPVINIGGTEYTVANLDGEHEPTESTLWDDYLLTGTESILKNTVINQETFLSLDVNRDDELDLYGKLGTNEEGKKYIDLRDDENELRSLSLLDDIDNITVEKAAEALSNILNSVIVVDDTLEANITNVLVKVFGSEVVSDELVNDLVGIMNSAQNTAAVSKAYFNAIKTALNN